MKQVRSRDGTEIGYVVSGEGPAFLLVHGTTADHRRWDRVSALLARRFTVFAMDRRGRGGSGDAPDYHVMREADDVAAVIEAAAEATGGPVAVLGHSYGAVCGLEAALLTDRAACMVLYEPPLPAGLPFAPPGVPERMQALLDRGESEAALEIMMREIVRMPDPDLEAYRRLPMWPVRVQLAPTIPRELALHRTYAFEPDRFAALQTPTALLLGGESPPPFRAAAEAIDAALPNSRVVILPGQQHVAMDVNPERFVRDVEQLIPA